VPYFSKAVGYMPAKRRITFLQDRRIIWYGNSRLYTDVQRGPTETEGHVEARDSSHKPGWKEVFQLCGGVLDFTPCLSTPPDSPL
jgi:hypothetical protein